MSHRLIFVLACLIAASWLGTSPKVLADDRKQASTVQTLEVGDSVTVKVASKQKFNPTGVKVSQGQHYAFAVNASAKWKDLNIVCDAGGWTSDQAPQITRKFIEKSEQNRRVPAANWFELIGTIGQNEDHHFQIGKRGDQWTYAANADGDLFLFANDLIGMYGNNHDSIEVTITRVAGPGDRQLPVNPPKP